MKSPCFDWFIETLQRRIPFKNQQKVPLSEREENVFVEKREIHRSPRIFFSMPSSFLFITECNLNQVKQAEI